MNIRTPIARLLSVTLATLGPIQAALPAAGPLPVDENKLLQQTLSLTPAADSALDALWLQQPAQPLPFRGATLARQHGVLRIQSQGEFLPYVIRSITINQTLGVPEAREMREQGCRIFIVDVSFDGQETSPDAIFQRFHGTARGLLEAVPDALVIPRFWIRRASSDFAQNHPDSLLMEENGNVFWNDQKLTEPNFLDAWRRDCGARLYQVLQLLGQSEYASHMVGVYIGAMNTGEWWYPKDGKFTWDYSPTRQQAFKIWLETKYPGTALDFLRARWQADTDAELFRLPTHAERLEEPLLPASRHSEYLQVLNLPITQAARYFAAIIKATSHGRLLAGMEVLSGLNTMNNNGTVYVSQLFDCPDIDFLGAPSPYDRRPGTFTPERSCYSSFERHDKMFLAEEDIRTHVVYGEMAGQGNPPATPAGTRHVLRRQFAAGILRRYHSYLMSFGSTWFSHAAAQDEVRTINRLYPLMLELGLERHSQIALVSDQDSQLYANYFANPTLLRHEISQIGADCDFYELRDFLDPAIFSRYRLIFFLNLRALSNQERLQLEAIKADGRTLVWMHDPGLTDLSEYGIDPIPKLQQLTALPLVSIEPDNDHHILIRRAWQQDAGRPAPPNNSMASLPPPEKIAPESVSPADFVPMNSYSGNLLATIRAIAGEGLDVLGVDGRERPCLVRKKLPDWTSVYTASCTLPPEVLRLLAAEAGCHLFSTDGDIVFAAGPFVAVHTSFAGNHRLHCRTPLPLLELYSGQILKPANLQVAFSAPAGETRLFCQTAEPEQLWQKLQALETRQQQELAAFRSQHPAPEAIQPRFIREIPKRPESAYAFSRQEFPGRYGPFALDFTPAMLLFSGPYDAIPEKVAELDRLATAPDAPPARSLYEPPLPSYERRLGSDYRKLLQRQPSRPGGLHWQAFSNGAWTELQAFGVSPGQACLTAFYLNTEPGNTLELLFAHDDPEAHRLWLNGNPLNGQPGRIGTLIRFAQAENLFVIRSISKHGKDDGYSLKFFEPLETWQPGATPPRSHLPQQAQIRLAPAAYNRQLVRVSHELPTGAVHGPESLFAASGLASGLEMHPVDPNLTYEFSVDLQERENARGFAYLVCLEYDHERKQIASAQVHNRPDSVTELAEPALVGSQTLWLRQAENWQLRIGDGKTYVAFGAAPDDSGADLPNRSLSSPITGIEKQGGRWQLQLSQPLRQNYPAGTRVRQHFNASTYNIIAAVQLSGENHPIKLKGEIHGRAGNLPGKKQFWPGARFFRVGLVVNLSAGQVQWQNLRLATLEWIEQDVPLTNPLP